MGTTITKYSSRFIEISMTPKRRVVDRLRKLYSGKWPYNRRSHTWHHESGWFVYATCPSWSGFEYDDMPTKTYNAYYRSDSKERVWC